MTGATLNSSGLNDSGSQWFIGSGSAVTSTQSDVGPRSYRFDGTTVSNAGYLYCTGNAPTFSSTQFVAPGTALGMTSGRASVNSAIPLGRYLVSFKVLVSAGASFAAADSVMISLDRQDTSAPTPASFVLSGFSAGQTAYEGVAYLNVNAIGSTYAAWTHCTGSPALTATFAISLLSIA